MNRRKNELPKSVIIIIYVIQPVHHFIKNHSLSNNIFNVNKRYYETNVNVANERNNLMGFRESVIFHRLRFLE